MSFFILTGAKDELAALVVHGEVDEQHGTLRLDRQPSQYSQLSFIFSRSSTLSRHRCVLAWISCDLLRSYSTHKYSKGFFKGQVA
jgi:hypothetical protein